MASKISTPSSLTANTPTTTVYLRLKLKDVLNKLPLDTWAAAHRLASIKRYRNATDEAALDFIKTAADSARTKWDANLTVQRFLAIWAETHIMTGVTLADYDAERAADQVPLTDAEKWTVILLIIARGSDTEYTQRTELIGLALEFAA